MGEGHTGGTRGDGFHLKRLLPGALALFLGLQSSCRTIDSTWGVPPFYEIYPTPSSVGSTKGNETFFRPLGSYERLGADARHLRFITPFLDFRWGPEERRYRVLPLFFYRSSPQYLSGEEMDWMLFPILFGGSDPDEGSYFAVFPFGGNLKGLFGQDEIRFVLFPIYWHSRDRERHSLHIVWPFYNTVWGGDWRGSRLWPFYGRYRSFTEDGALRYDRRFVLWPFYLRRDDQMHIRPTELFFSFPFYGEMKNDRVQTYTFFWPFFQTTYDQKYDRRSYAGYFLPYRIAHGQTDIWPFFGVKKLSPGTSVGGVVRRTYRHFALWPIERYEWATDGLEESTRFWLLPLLWHFYYIDKDTLETRKYFKLWPVFQYQRQGQDVSFELVSPLWFFREDYERLYSRWFNIFRYRWKLEVSGWELLYGAIMYRREPGREEKVFSVLGGLFECGSRGGGLVLRLLYIPWW